jgi:DNA-3-methyladenine glycosylase II
MSDQTGAAPEAHLADDPALAPHVAAHGPVDLTPAEDFFARFVRSICRQQVSTASAAAIEDRLFAAVSVTPAGVREASTETLREAGLSRQKVDYVRNVARAVAERGYSRSYFEGMDDAAVVEELTSITGVGTWTAKMQLLFSLGRPDVFPVEDLGIRAAMRSVCDAPDDRGAMVERASAWRPYRSYASVYLWRATD